MPGTGWRLDRITVTGLLAVVLACGARSVRSEEANPAPSKTAMPEAPAVKAATAPEIVVNAFELPRGALSEFNLWKDPSSPGGKLAGTPNEGGELDPPPENDPHVTFKVPVQSGIPYRCWIHMKVGKAKGKSRANLVYVQFTDAVDESGKAMFKTYTKSCLLVRGPRQEGWAWVGRDLADSKSTEPRIYFRRSGEVTVRVQAGMEGVGFDQFVLSPARFLEKPPAGGALTE